MKALLFLCPVKLSGMSLYILEPELLSILMQLPNIMDRYSPLLEGITVSKMDDWACVSGTRKTNLAGR